MTEFIVPVAYRGGTYTGYELRNIRGSVLSDTQNASGNMLGMTKFLAGCIEHVYGDKELDNSRIEDFVRHMPYNNAEHIALIVFSSRPDAEGAIEHITTCPRCKTEYMYEYISDEVDQRIAFDDLEIVRYEEEGQPTILVELSEPITIQTTKGEVVETVESLGLRLPDMNSCIAAESMYQNNMIDMQYSMYVHSIIQVNGVEPQSAFLKNWGMYLFKRMYEGDIKTIASQINAYGVQKRLWRTCGKCGKHYSFTVDISDFFG